MSDDVIDYLGANIPTNARAPIPDAVEGGGMIFTVQVPVEADGSYVEGRIEVQTRAVLSSLRKTLKSIDAKLEKIMHITVYLVDISDWDGMNAVWQEFFYDRSPSRVTIEVGALADPRMRIEMVAQVLR